MTKQFVAGIVGAPFGLKGSLKVKSLSGETSHLLKLKSVVLRWNGVERVFGVEESSASPPSSVIMRFAGFSSPEEARRLSGAELLVDRENAAPLNHGEFYVEDIKGLHVVSGEGESADNGKILGHIVSVIEGGGGDLAEIRLTDGGIRLVPFRKEFFPRIDTAKGLAVLENTWILE